MIRLTGRCKIHNQKPLKTASLMMFIMVFLLSNFAIAQEANSVAELKKQIEALQNRVEELESSKDKRAEDDSWGFFDRRRGGPWDPFDEMRRMQDEMDRMFQDSFSSRGLSKGGMFSSNMSFDHDFDIKETDEGYQIRFDMKGLDQEKVDIDINEHSITVKGEHSRRDTEENPTMTQIPLGFRARLRLTTERFAILSIIRS